MSWKNKERGVLLAKDEYGLTPKQRAFADEYIFNGGNGTQAYLKVYKNVKNEDTARANASRLLANANVARYIREKTEMTLLERGLLAQKAINHLTDLAMGTETTSRSTVYNNLTEELEQDNVYTNSAPPKVQVEAMALLMKFLGVDDANRDLTRQKQELEIEKLQSQIGGNEQQDDKIADLISMLKDEVRDGD